MVLGDYDAGAVVDEAVEQRDEGLDVGQVTAAGGFVEARHHDGQAKLFPTPPDSPVRG